MEAAKGREGVALQAARRKSTGEESWCVQSQEQLLQLEPAVRVRVWRGWVREADGARGPSQPCGGVCCAQESELPP